MTEEQRRDIDELLRTVPAAPHPTVEQLRRGFETLMAGMSVPDGLRLEEGHLGGLPALRVVPPTGGTRGTLLYFHGGAYVFGSPATALSLTGSLAVGTDTTAWSVDYRLAPEHPFPAAVEDGLTAYRALLDQGVDAGGLVVAGDSAGGGLAVTTVLQARDAGLPLPAAVVTFSAGLDRTRSGPSRTTKLAADPIFTPAALARTQALYLDGASADLPLASPATRADLRGFPPILLQVGGNELLRDDTTLFAARAVEADVEVVLDVVPGVPHVFQAFHGALDDADRALERAVLFLRQHLDG